MKPYKQGTNNGSGLGFDPVIKSYNKFPVSNCKSKCRLMAVLMISKCMIFTFPIRQFGPLWCIFQEHMTCFTSGSKALLVYINRDMATNTNTSSPCLQSTPGWIRAALLIKRSITLASVCAVGDSETGRFWCCDIHALRSCGWSEQGLGI